ncbi:competence type IV pilus assembly protein ComGB [Alteribacillus iranensis]|uniref:Competence-related pilin export protein ComGB n=1 Tax=Alteribacillus iranensis TaxID=930128 RepID=A0A1I1ZEJ2_9BACI|nr:competence type IV pilus assembly protein ComGB [Alteribacillus iranensis]SFE30119.1 competence-related pilin export protein ComGB [Alteribacillus iranensis]
MGNVWKKQEAAGFLVKIGELLEQGYSLDHALEILTWEQSGDVKEKVIRIQEDLRKGIPVHDVLASHDFPADIAAYVFFAEACGDLPAGLQGAGKLYLKRIEAVLSIRRFLRYPLLLLWLLIVVSVIMLHVLFPQFSQLFSSLNMEFPFFTVFMIQVFRYSPFLGFLLIPIILVLGLYYYMKFRHYSSAKQWKLLCKVPLLSYFLQLFITYYFSLQLSAMLRGGLSIYEACTVLEKQQHFMFFQSEGTFLKEQLREGSSLSTALEAAGWYRQELKFVVQHGQSTGKLEEDLYYYSERIMQVLDRKIKKAVMTIQPILFCLIGIVILAMFLSIFLPMFQLMTSL